LSATAATIYKWTGADGVVHYSDQPTPGAEKIFTNSASMNIAVSSNHTVHVQMPESQKSAGSGYVRSLIASPTAEQTFFEGTVPVRLDLEPDLMPGQTVVWRLNGKILDDQAPTAVQFVLQNIPRGTYALSAAVMIPETQQIVSSPSVTFYVRQPSALSPQHK
jgi:hypothetical protein